MWEVPEASQRETCEEAILEVDPPASGKLQRMDTLADISLQPRESP